MSDTHAATEVKHMPSVKNVAHKPSRFTQKQSTGVIGRYSRSVLTAMLEYRQSVIERLVNRCLRHNSDNPAHNFYPDLIRSTV